MSIFKRFQSERAFSYIVIVLLIAVNIGLFYRLTQLEAIIQRDEAMRRLAERHVIAVGDIIPELEGVGVNGVPIRVALAGQDRPSILYVFAPGCHWCARNWQNITALSNKIQSSYRLLAISLSKDGLGNYMSGTPWHFQVYSVDMDRPLGDKRKTFSGDTPQTLLIDKNGQVQSIWDGAYSGQTQRDLERSFDISLPGLTAEVAKKN